MGKKVKTGKSRKDKFYQLAKESGYRSRAAFKLLQLNRTYRFLENSRICIDLCAAPGGWLQVAATHMPMSSVIIGVDLAPIRAIGNVITHMEDITTAKCRQLLKRDLNDSKADIVLHDGAPNVGKNWILDAYQQNILVLQSFKLASEFLRKGGTFITKVFRSKDYYSLLWVLQQFFKKVESTKPQASRNESAEIFVVCQNYLAPDQIDPKFYDIKYVFNDVDTDGQQMSKKAAADILFKSDKVKRNRGGYPDGDMTLHHSLNSTVFILNENYMELLANANEIIIDDDRVLKHKSTTIEVKECFKDIKVLGKNEIKAILKWRLKVKELFEDKDAKEEVKPKAVKQGDEENGENESDAEKQSNDEEDIDNALHNAIDKEKKVDKRKKKKLMKEKRKLRDKLALKMVLPDDQNDFHLQGDNEIFSLSKIKTKQQLMELQNALPGLEISEDESEADDMLNGVSIENGLSNKRKTKASYSKDSGEDLDEFYEHIEKGEDYNSDLESNVGGDDEDPIEIGTDDDDAEANPLIDRLENVTKEKNPANSWFNKSAFSFLEQDEENDLINSIDGVMTKKDENKKTNKRNHAVDAENASDSESDDEEIIKTQIAKKKKQQAKDIDEVEDDGKFEVVPANNVKLSAYELSVGEMLVNSKKKKGELIDESFNRYAGFGDIDGLPQWFVDDETEHCKKVLEVPKDVLERHRKKFEEINARPIKKVIEAQARKKRRMAKRLDRARKKAETVTENPNITDQERNKELKQIYKRAGMIGKKKTEVKYIVAKRGTGKRGVGGAVKGPYRVVDKRLKKDKKMAKLQSKKTSSKKRKPSGSKAK